MTNAAVYEPLVAAPERPEALAENAGGAARAEGSARPEHASLGDAVDWERLWLATQRRPWSSLALIPIGAAVPTTLLAGALAETGRIHLGAEIVVRDATAVSLTSLQAELGDLAARAGSDGRAIVALPPLLASPAGLALARAADAAVLCVALGESAIAEAERVLEELGRERVLGSVILRERKGTK